jgi:hypothetical protein
VFITVEGALVEEGASVVGRTSTHQIAVGSVAEGGHTQSFIPVEGFSILSSQLASGAVSVVLRAFMGGHLPRAHLVLLDLYSSLDQAAIVSGSSIFCICCIPPSTFLIYRHISQTGFPRGGFIQGHVDQKYLCTK